MISQTWVVSGYGVGANLGTYVLSTQPGYLTAVYEPSNPQLNDVKIALHIYEGSSWESEGLYDVDLHYFTWQHISDGENDYYDWIEDSNGSSGNLPANGTHFDDNRMWIADYPYQESKLTKLATVDDLDAY